MAFIRFPFPSFDHKALRGLEWSRPEILDAGAAAAKAGDAATRGAFAVAADDALFDKFSVEGEHRHAVICCVPAGTRVVGRSNSWWLQRAIIVDSLDASSANVIADWRTPRPINARFGPEDGITLDGGPVYVISCHALGDHWLGNRTLFQDTDQGFRVVATAKDDTANFDEFCLTFAWED